MSAVGAWHWREAWLQEAFSTGVVPGLVPASPHQETRPSQQVRRDHPATERQEKNYFPGRSNNEQKLGS